MNGWLKIHRKIQEHWIWQDEKYLKWWLTIILNVNHEPRSFPVGTEIHVCNPGQSFRSIEQWTAMFSCSKKTTIRFFEMLKNDSMIQCEIIGKGNRRKHMLSVVNWAEYQQKETEKDLERVPECSVNGNPNVTPNKNDKKEKNNISVIFENFRQQYPGSKRGLNPELDNFLKKNKSETVELLLPALQIEITHKEKLLQANQFVAGWKNLKTWINDKCWTQEFPEVKKVSEVKVKSLQNEFQINEPKYKAI